MSGIEGRVVLVTGAAGEIGEAVVERLLAQRAEVILVDRDADKLKKVQERIFNPYRDMLAYVLSDDTSAREVKSVVAKVENKYGRLECLVNAIDFCEHDISVNLLEKGLKTLFIKNVLPVQLFCHYAIPIMRRQGFGRIINVNSLDYLGVPGEPNYVAAKSALFGFTRALALDVVKDGITVNSVVVGDTETSAHDLQVEERNILVKRIPVRRLGSGRDVAYAVCFFASDQSSYITGQTLFVCGGKSVHFSMSI